MNVSLMTLGAQQLGEGGGTTAVAIYAILMYASDFCWPLLYGISDSLSPAIVIPHLSLRRSASPAKRKALPASLLMIPNTTSPSPTGRFL